MTIKEIAILVVGVVLALLYVGLVCFQIAKVIKKRKASGAVDLSQTLAEIAKSVMPLVGTAEIAFRSVSDKKTGALKLKDVLNDIKDMCSEKGVNFDKPYWTDYINKAVELININRETPQELTTNVPATDKTATAAN